jgi:hypothetical protein
MPIAELLAQVVEHNDGLPQVEQINIVNKLLLRDPAWQNERILRPQGIVDNDGQEVLGHVLLDSESLIDVHGDRFQRLWQQYKSDMSHHSWAGNAEMSAIKDLYQTNILYGR